MLDRYHEMMMLGIENHVKSMRQSAAMMKEKAKIINAQADLLESEALDLEAMRINWELALKPIAGEPI